MYLCDQCRSKENKKIPWRTCKTLTKKCPYGLDHKAKFVKIKSIHDKAIMDKK